MSFTHNSSRLLRKLVYYMSSGARVLGRGSSPLGPMKSAPICISDNFTDNANRLELSKDLYIFIYQTITKRTNTEN